MSNSLRIDMIVFTLSIVKHTNQVWNVYIYIYIYRSLNWSWTLNLSLKVKYKRSYYHYLVHLFYIVFYAHSFGNFHTCGNILLKITIYSIINCFASPPCKIVLRSAKCIYGKWHTWFESYRTCINIKVTNKTKTNVLLSISSEYKSHAICVLGRICTLFWMHCKMTLCHILKVTSNSSFEVFISSTW